MKNTKMVLSVAVVATLALTVVVILSRQPQPENTVMESPPKVEARDPSLAAVENDLPAKPAAAPVVTPAAPAVVVDLPETPIPSVNPMQVSTTQILGRVNGTPIRLKDLVPVPPGEAEKSMTPEQYQSRLERAIEAELVFQEAERQNVGLTPRQQERVDKITQDHEATLEEYRQQGIEWSSVGTTELEFEKRLLSAQMVQQNLVARQSSVSPSPDPEVQSRYELARSDMLEQLMASADIATAVAAPQPGE